ncbi:MAG: NnrU family protein [Granulosicoccus sp.]
MLLLILGLLIWSVVHFIPSLAQPFKAKWLERMGATGYKISFSLIVVLSIALMVFGWRSTTPTFLYALPGITRPIGMVLMVFAFLLFGASHHVTRIKQFIRHPQLVSVIIWSFAHLLMNGDSRSVLLFGGLGIWAILEIFAINRREGAWQKSEIPTWQVEIKGSAISLAIFAVAALAHPYIAGVPLH